MVAKYKVACSVPLANGWGAIEDAVERYYYGCRKTLTPTGDGKTWTVHNANGSKLDGVIVVATANRLQLRRELVEIV